MVVLSRHTTGQWLAQGCVREGERRVSEREETAPSHNFFGDENVFREVSCQSVPDSDLGDTSAPVAIALQVIDGWVHDCGLNDVSLAGTVAVFQLLPHLDERHGTLVAKNQ